MENLEGVPAIIYSVLWQTEQMGFLKRILDDIGIKNLRILVFLEDYKPGALLELKGELGRFNIIPVDNLEAVDFDGAFIGEMKYVLRLVKGHMFSKGFWYLITGKIKLKGIRSLLKFLKLLQKMAM